MTSPSRASWRVVFARTDTDATIATFDCEISRLSRYVSPKVGALQVQIPVPNADVGRDAAKVFGGSGFLSMYVYRNEDVWWGGFLDEVDVDSAGDYPVLTASGATFEAYPDRREMREEEWRINFDQVDIIAQVWRRLQLNPGGNLRVNVRGDYPQSGVVRIREEPYKRHEIKTYGSILKEQTHRSDGCEWIIECHLDSSGMRRRDLVIGYPVIGRPADGTILTFPGNVISYQMLDSALDGAIAFQARGKAPDPVGTPGKPGNTDGTGGGGTAAEKQPPVMSKVVTNDVLVKAGYTLTETTIDRPQEKDAAVLDRWAELARDLRSGPLLLPQVTCRMDGFNQSILGGVVDLRINDYLWPVGPKGEPGYRASARVIGYEIDPGEFGGDDIVKLIFENPTDADEIKRGPD